MKKVNMDDWQVNARSAICDAYSETQYERSLANEDARFAIVAGAQWEGSTAAGYSMERFDDYPRYELNKVAKECDRIISEYRRNRLEVRFKSSDVMGSQELSNKLNDAFRSDWKDSNGKAALDNAFQDIVLGGYGCVRLEAVYEDEMNPLSEEKKVIFEPVYDSSSSVLFDLNAKKYDKSDARWAAEIFTMSPERFEEKYPDASLSSIQPTSNQTLFDWTTPDVVYVARYYEVKLEDTEVVGFINELTKENVVYDLADLNIDDDRYENDDLEVEGADDELTDDSSAKGEETGFSAEFKTEETKIIAADGDISLYDELLDAGYVEVSRRKIKKRRVYCGILSGSEWVVEPVRIAGEHIPLIPAYGKRYFIDNQERCEGHVRKVKDAQRLENLMVSMIADNASQASGDNIPIVNIEGIPQNMLHQWSERNVNRPAFLPTKSLRDANGNPVAANPVVGNTGVTQMSPALAGLLQYTGQAIEKITGYHGINHIPSNIATDTVDSIFNRIDNQSFIYMDNIALTLKRVGEVWLSMKRELTGSDKVIRMLDDDGEETFGVMTGEVRDRQTDKVIALNDLSVGKYDVDVDVSESTDSQRKAAARNLLDLLSKIPPQSPYYNTVLSFYITKMDGYKMDDMKDLVYKQMLASGMVEPKTEKEKAELAQKQQMAAQQPNPQVILAQAEMQKAQAEMINSQVRAQEVTIKGVTAHANAQKAQSDTVLNYVKADDISKQQVIEAMRIMREANQDVINDAMNLNKKSY